MKKIFWICLSLIWILSACGAQTQPTDEQSLIPIGDDSTGDTGDGLTPAERAAVSFLASDLNLPADEISVLSTEAVKWPDGCLGIHRAGVMCTEAIVPGYKIILEADGRQFEFHTNESGSQVVRVVQESEIGLAEKEIIKQLASNLGLEREEISLVSSSDVEFSDACLGVETPGGLCAQVITPGKIIVLEANGFKFEYHVSADGSQVQPATLALTWKREGGIAGFCNGLTVFLSGEVYASDCRLQPEGAMKTFATLLSSKEQEQFFAWARELGQASIESSDPEGVADRMIVELKFQGVGGSEPTDEEKRALIEFGQELYGEVIR